MSDLIELIDVRADWTSSTPHDGAGKHKVDGVHAAGTV